MKAELTRSGFRAITFDVGGTLIEPWPSVGHVYAQVAAEHGVGNCSPEILNRQFAAAWRARRDFQHTREQWAAVVDATFAGLTESAPSRNFFPALYDRFARPDAWRIFPDVLPALQALRARGMPLGIVSNWDERLRPLLRALELEPYFQVIVVSCEVGAIKPDRRIFEAACRQLGTAPETVLHIGDSEEMDLRGAESAGMTGFLVERSDSVPQRGQLRNLLALEEALGILHQTRDKPIGSKE